MKNVSSWLFIQYIAKSSKYIFVCFSLWNEKRIAYLNVPCPCHFLLSGDWSRVWQARKCGRLVEIATKGRKNGELEGIRL